MTVPTTPPTKKPTIDPPSMGEGGATSSAASADFDFATQRATRSATARKESGFVESQAATPPFPGQANEDLEKQGAWWHQNGPLAKSPFSRVVLAFGVFAIGAAVGLGVVTTRWVNKPAGTQPPATAIHRAAPIAGSVAALPGDLSDSRPSGIRPSELPYDGSPPEIVENASRAVAANGRTTNAAELSSGDGGAGQGTTQAGYGSEGTVLPRISNGVVPKVAGASEDPDRSEPIASQLKPNDKQVAIAGAKHRAPPRTAKDNEIERIRRQAAEELKKKSEGQRIARESGAKVSPAKRVARGDSGRPRATVTRFTSKRPALARCEQASNFIWREKCKWQVCNGRWGRDGCPSYERQASWNH